MARPTTEWHQHIQSRRFNPCVVAQISRGLTGMGARASGFHGHGRAVFRIPAEMGTRRAVSLRPRRRGWPGMVPDVGLMSARSPGCFCGGVWVWVVSVSGMRKPLGACAPRGFLYVWCGGVLLSHTCRVQYHRRASLSFRVRNGTGRLTWAMAAANLLLYGQTLGSAGLWRPGNRTADADMSMFRLVARQCSLPSGVVCRRKMRSNRQGLEC